MITDADLGMFGKNRSLFRLRRILRKYRPRCFLSELIRIKIVIIPVQLEELAVRTCLGYAPVSYNKYPVGITYRRKPVGYDKARSAFKHRRYRILYKLLCLRVDGRRRFVEHEYLRIGKYYPCKRHKLLFTR